MRWCLNVFVCYVYIGQNIKLVLYFVRTLQYNLVRLAKQLPFSYDETTALVAFLAKWDAIFFF